jgi:serine/threonine-protein kinase
MLCVLFVLCLAVLVALWLLYRARRLSSRALLFSSLPVAVLFLLLLVAEIDPLVHKGPVAFLLLVGSVIFGSVLFRFTGPRGRGVRLAFPAARQGPCPPIGRLKDLLAERLPHGEHLRLAAHLEVCPACQYRVEGLTAGHEPWPGLARKLTRQPPEPALKQVMENLKGNKEGEATSDEPVFSADLPLGFLSPPDKPGQLGRLEHYEVLAEVGRGGMGIVLKAFDPSLHRVVAIKVLAPQFATSGVARQRFLREAKAAAAVTHDHIVTIHAVGEANGLPYLVMHYVAGLSLQQRIDKEGPLELKEVLRIGMQTAAGLAAAHAQGIVHRDIKPGNILLEDGVQRVKITDFGLARAMDDASLTQSGFVAGSPQYMAPEQARGEALDHRADLFSLGSVLYTMCTGRPPFRAANTLAVLRRVSEDMPRPIRETNPEVPDWLAAVVAKLQAKDPAERFQSAGEVVEVLGQNLAGLQHSAWVPPPGPSPVPAGAGANGAGLPTSMTICPSCGANLHVPERLVGSIVHCSECGKPFQVEEGSEVIQVARPMPAPFGRRCRGGKRPARWVAVAAGGAALLFLVVLLASLLHSARSREQAEWSRRTHASTAPTLNKADPFWKSTLNWFPAEATLFGALDLKAFGSLTLDDEATQTALRLAVPEKTRALLTQENLGRIRIDRVSLAYYDDPKPDKARAILQVEGLALDGRKRISTFLRQVGGDEVRVEEGDRNLLIGSATRVPTGPEMHLLLAEKPIRVSGPELPFALGLVDDQRAFLARSLAGSSKGAEHVKVLEELPWFDFFRRRRRTSFLLSGYNPPWVQAALREIPPNACGLLLGEIPAGWRKLLTEGLELRACPRSFVCYLERARGGVTLSLILNVDKAGADRILRDDLEKWRGRALAVLQARFPALRQEPEALALLEKTLQTVRWVDGGRGGPVRARVQINQPTWRALEDLVKRAFP